MVDCYVGEIRLFAGTVTPQGFRECNGELLQISGNEALYSLLGTVYGGDGRTNFGLPDLRGRVPIGVQTMAELGTKGGSEVVSLTTANMPVHRHTVSVSSGPANSMMPSPQRVPGDVGNNFYYYNPPVGDTALNLALANDTVQFNAVGNQPHSNMQPSMALRYIIAIYGTYPAS